MGRGLAASSPRTPPPPRPFGLRPYRLCCVVPQHPENTALDCTADLVGQLNGIGHKGMLQVDAPLVENFWLRHWFPVSSDGEFFLLARVSPTCSATSVNPRAPEVGARSHAASRICTATSAPTCRVDSAVLSMSRNHATTGQNTSIIGITIPATRFRPDRRLLVVGFRISCWLRIPRVSK